MFLIEKLKFLIIEDEKYYTNFVALLCNIAFHVFEV